MQRSTNFPNRSHASKPLQRYAAKARAAAAPPRPRPGPPAPPKPVDDDFGPDVFAVAPSEALVATSAPVAEPEPARAAAAPADDDVSDDDLL